MTKTLSNLQIPIFKPWALIIASGCFEMNENVNWEWAHVFLSCSPHTQPLVLSKRVRVMRNKNKTIDRKISLVFFKELLGICDVWNISESIGELLWQVFAESACYRFKYELTEPGEENNFLFLCCGRVWHFLSNW